MRLTYIAAALLATLVAASPVEYESNLRRDLVPRQSCSGSTSTCNCQCTCGEGVSSHADTV